MAELMAIPGGQKIMAGGEWRKLFACARRSLPGQGPFPVFGDPDRGSVQLIPRAQWLEIDLSRYVLAIKDQDGIGKCLCSAIAAIMENSRKQAGLKPIVLSDDNLYGQVTTVDQGSDFEEDLAAAYTQGIAPEAVIPRGSWQRSKWPSGWQQQAIKYRFLEIFDCPTPDHIGTALQLGFHCLLGVSVTDAFEPDSSGIIQPYQTGGINHGVYAAGMKMIGGAWYLMLINSWGLTWGKQGWAWYPLSCLPTSGVSSWCGRSVSIPPDEPLFG